MNKSSKEVRSYRVVDEVPRSPFASDPRFCGRCRIIGNLLRMPARARYNCTCGAWIILPMTNDIILPHRCECGLYHYWEDHGRRIIETADWREHAD